MAVAWRPSIVAVSAACVLATSAAIVAFLGRALSRRLRRPRHLAELDRVLRTSSGERVQTSEALAVSVHPLDNQQLDVVWSHSELTRDLVEDLAGDLFESYEIVAGYAHGLFHVITYTAARRTTANDEHCGRRPTLRGSSREASAEILGR